MTESAQQLRRNSRVAYRELGGEGGEVLLHLDTGAYYAVNNTGRLIWSLTEDDIALPDLLARARERLPEAPATLEEDVAAFIEDLSARGLIERGNPPERPPA